MLVLKYGSLYLLTYRLQHADLLARQTHFTPLKLKIFMAANRFASNTGSTKVPHSASSSRKNHVPPGRKVGSLRVPPAKRIKAQAMLVEGHSQRQIGRTLHMSAHTVAKIVKTEDFAQHIKEMQQRVFAIAPDAIESFRKRVATDGNLAYKFLKDLCIIPSPAAMAQFMAAATPPESGYARQAKMVACSLLESRRNFGVKLTPAMEKALAEDAEPQESKPSEAKSPRR